MFDAALKKSSALLAAMLTMGAAWCVMHLPGSDLLMVTFAFLASADLCDVSDFNLKLQRCFRMVCYAAAAQFMIGITADYPIARSLLALPFSFFILATMQEKQDALIALLIAGLSLSSSSGFTAAVDRCINIASGGAVAVAVTTVSNLFIHGNFKKTSPEQPYSFRQAAIISAEITTAFIIAQLFKHEQFYWAIPTIIFVHMAESQSNPLPALVKERIIATPAGILSGGLALGCFNDTSIDMIYIVPVTGTLSFFMLYLKNDYFIFTFLFMLTLTVFTDWMLGTGSRFHFAEITFVRTLATVIGGILVLCGKNFMQEDTP